MPLLAVMIPNESTLVTSSYEIVPPIVTLPVKVAATPVKLEMAMFGVPVSPEARSAVPVTSPVTLPSTAPLNVVAVTTPVTFTPLSPTVTALPRVETPETDKLSKNLTLVEVVILNLLKQHQLILHRLH